MNESLSGSARFTSLITDYGKRSILEAKRPIVGIGLARVMKQWLLAIALVGLTVSCDRHGVISAYLRLRADSPLPSLAVLPPGTTRNEVSVTITIYEATTTPTWKVKFEVRDKRNGRIVQEALGSGYWHPDSLHEKAPGGTYPNWIILEVNGTKDIYESTAADDLLRIVKKP